LFGEGIALIGIDGDGKAGPHAASHAHIPPQDLLLRDEVDLLRAVRGFHHDPPVRFDAHHFCIFRDVPRRLPRQKLAPLNAGVVRHKEIVIVGDTEIRGAAAHGAGGHHLFHGHEKQFLPLADFDRLKIPLPAEPAHPLLELFL
jgi:hypothetical protein